MWRAKTSLSRALLPSSHSPLSRVFTVRHASFLNAFRESRTDRVLSDADSHPDDPHRQYEAMRMLAQTMPAEAVRRYESQQFATNPQIHREYLRACGETGSSPDPKLQPQTVSHVPQPPTPSSYASSYSYGVPLPPPPPQQQQPLASSSYQPQQYSSAAYNFSSPSSNASSPYSGSFGGLPQPLTVTIAEPSGMSQLWRTVRYALLGLLMLSGVSVLMEDRAGMARSMSLNVDNAQASQPDTRFEDVKGCDEAKAEVAEIVEFLRDPNKFTRLGAKLPKGVLLVGPPGTGKTLLAKAIAGEAGVPFLYVSGSEFEEMFVGVGAKRVRELFALAKRSAPCIVFIDEIDAVGATRNPKDQQYMRMTLNQLLAEMDGFSSSEGVIVIGATNFPQALDKALVRPGRFDRHVMVTPPDVQGRFEILKLHFGKNKVPLDEKTVDLRILARNTPGMVGADLANLVNLAALKAALSNKQSVTSEEIEYARDRILMGAARTSVKRSLDARRRTAYHEAGHALTAIVTPGSAPVHKATIIARGQALGMVQQMPHGDDAADGEGYTLRQMRAMIDVALGGRIAEEIVFGREEISTGASSDIEHATRVAKEMVARFGMSETMGTVDWTGHEGDQGSEESRRMVEQEVKKMIADSYERVKKVMQSKETDLHKVARELLERETLTGKEIEELVFGRNRVTKRINNNGSGSASSVSLGESDSAK
jgi:ATP-dependent metalloprotease